MGKTKELIETKGLLNIVFKDSVTGENGIMDSGGNQVVGEIKNKGSASLAVSSFSSGNCNQMVFPRIS